MVPAMAAVPTAIQVATPTPIPVPIQRAILTPIQPAIPTPIRKAIPTPIQAVPTTPIQTVTAAAILRAIPIATQLPKLVALPTAIHQAVMLIPTAIPVVTPTRI